MIELYSMVWYPYELYLSNVNRPLLLQHLSLYLLFLFNLEFFFSLIGKIEYLLAYIQAKGIYFLYHQNIHKAEEYFNVDSYFEFLFPWVIDLTSGFIWSISCWSSSMQIQLQCLCVLLTVHGQIYLILKCVKAQNHINLGAL